MPSLRPPLVGEGARPCFCCKATRRARDAYGAFKHPARTGEQKTNVGDFRPTPNPVLKPGGAHRHESSTKTYQLAGPEIVDVGGMSGPLPSQNQLEKVGSFAPPAFPIGFVVQGWGGVQTSQIGDFRPAQPPGL